MKFTRKEFITTTVFDKELTVKSEIDTVVKNLHKIRAKNNYEEYRY